MPRHATENFETAEPEAAPVPAMSTETLLTLLVTMQQQLAESQKAQAESNKALAEAILESGRPKQPLKTEREIANELNEKLFKEQQAEQEKRTRENKKYAEDTCEHIAGCSLLSEEHDSRGRTSIIWHRGDVGQTTGICTVCQHIFKESDPDFAVWRKKKSFNKDSASGFRTVFDPLKAREKSYLHDS